MNGATKTRPVYQTLGAFYINAEVHESHEYTQVQEL
jgi:hypothetical protein